MANTETDHDSIDQNNHRIASYRNPVAKNQTLESHHLLSGGGATLVKNLASFSDEVTLSKSKQDFVKQRNKAVINFHNK